MALVKMKDLLRRAEEKNIGCGAFSVGNMAFEKFSASPDGTDDGTGCKGG